MHFTTMLSNVWTNNALNLDGGYRGLAVPRDAGLSCMALDGP